MYGDLYGASATRTIEGNFTLSCRLETVNKLAKEKIFSGGFLGVKTYPTYFSGTTKGSRINESFAPESLNLVDKSKYFPL